MANTAVLRIAPILPAPENTFLTLPKLNSLFSKGLKRGSLAEIWGPRSSGRSSLSHYVLARATAGGEVCAVVDLFDSFSPESAARAGVLLNHLVWVRARGNAEHALRTIDLILHAGGFGIVLLDLCDATPRILNGIPLSYWFRFRRAVEHTPTILLICGDHPQAKSCAANIELGRKVFQWSGRMPFSVLRSVEAYARVRTDKAVGQAAGIELVS